MNRDDTRIISKVYQKGLSNQKVRLAATLKTVKNAIEKDIKGDFVECGVWKGAHALVAALTIKAYGSDKKVWLYDTFSGMTEPTEDDYKLNKNETPASEISERVKDWCVCSKKKVESNFEHFDVEDYAIYVEGDVCETLNDKYRLPLLISVLRLDTDFYASTKKELDVLYPLICRGGSLLVDDYGAWAGSRKAVDEYMETLTVPPTLKVTDRMAIEYHNIGRK